jgi:CDP-diglyceride synthetase
MPKKDDIVTELNWTSEKISSLVWSLNVGTLGTTWSLLIANRFSIRNAIWILVPCLLSLLCEMAQYFSGYWLALRIEEDMRRNNRKEYEYF